MRRKINMLGVARLNLFTFERTGHGRTVSKGFEGFEASYPHTS